MKYPSQRKVSTPGSMAGVRIFGIRASGGVHARSQRGVVLILTLIVLVAMTLAAIALVRSVDTGNVVAGNLAFKQGESHAGDAGTEAAIAYLRAVQASGNAFAVDPASDNDGALGTGYRSSIDANLDITGNSHNAQRALVDWGYNNCSIAANGGCYEPSTKLNVGAGYSVSYIIQRMCSTPNTKVTSGLNSCVSFTSQSGQSPNRSALDYAHNRRFALTPVPYFHITSRVTGPRNTVSYIDTIVHF